MSYEQPPRGRLARLFEAADRRHVPLRTILVTVGVAVATYLVGKLMYLLRESPAPAAERADESGDPVAQHRPHPTVRAGDLN